ncbi:unnamed protein product [Sphagnum balticum]
MASSQGMLLGHDLSTVIQCERNGTKYFDFDLSNPKPPESIIAAHGANLVRLRLWVNPPAGYSDLPSVLQFSQRAKQANLKVLLCLHLSDYWADPGKQTTPAAWRDLDFDTLSITVNNYVADVIDALKAQGTPPFIVAVGNEVSNGVLWPIGSLRNTKFFTGLLKSGLAAVKRQGIASMIHINNGQDQGLVTWFMDLMHANQVEFDYLGLSFYSGDGASLSDLESSLKVVATRYRKPVVVVETANFWTAPNESPNTQAAALSELLKVVSSVPGDLGLGVVYWESAWLPLGEAYPGEGNHFWNRSLWDKQGRPLPALKCYEPYSKGHHVQPMGAKHHWFRRHDEV